MIMHRNKVLELAREGGLVHQWQTQGEQHDILKTLERFAALIERGDAEPVASVHIKDGCLIGSQRKSDADFPDGQYGLYPIGTHPATAVDAEPALNEWLDKTEWVQKRRDWPFPQLGMHRADVMRRYIEHLEAKSGWDSQPVGYTNEGYKGMQYANAEAYKEIRPDFIERNKLTAPLYKHPTPAVVAQLVDGLTGIIDFIEIDNLKIDQDALRIARAALAAAKEAGL